MMHNQPYALDKTVVEERKFADVLKETYTRLDGLEARSREFIAEAVRKFTNDPADAIVWRAESAVSHQTTLSILTEIRMLINHCSTVEEVKENFQTFTSRYHGHIIQWASSGETSTSGMSNIASRITLSATANVFGTWGFGDEIARSIDNDIEETKKRVVVLEFVDLKVEEHFRLSPDASSMLYRKLSPRKAVECVYPINTATKQTVEARTKVYLFRVPLETDVLYAAESVAA